MSHELPIPKHLDPRRLGEVWKVDYQQRAADAEAWATRYGIQPAAGDTYRICLVAVDVQNSFCLPGFELFVGGRSGSGAVDDNRRLCEFIYRNLAVLTEICPTMDTHQAMQVFHAAFWVNDHGEHPHPYTLISHEDVVQRRWMFNPALSEFLGVDADQAQRYLAHYTKALQAGGKYTLTIWPYHAMLGGIGHALTPAFEEAVFFHSIARSCQPDVRIKGHHPLTEHYSVLGPEVREGPDGEAIAGKDEAFIEKLLRFDAVLLAGQAKSHCVAWTIADLLQGIEERDRRLASKVYLLEDCTSPVVVPGAMDYTAEANVAFRRFADAGMHVVRSTTPLSGWPGMAGPDIRSSLG